MNTEGYDPYNHAPETPRILRHPIHVDADMLKPGPIVYVTAWQGDELNLIGVHRDPLLPALP